MEYDWEKIFESKTNKELYGIVTGKTVSAKEARKIAKQELERRKFDFNEMEANRNVWELSDLISEEEYKNVFDSSVHITLRTYLFITTGIILISIFLIKFSAAKISLELVLFLIGAVTIITFIENLTYKIKKQKSVKRIKKIKNLKEKLGDELLKNKSNQIFAELERQNKRTSKEINFLLIILLIIAVIIWLSRMFVFMRME